MYTTLLFLHSWLRWIVLGAGLLAALGAWAGWLGRRPYTSGARGLARLYVIALDVQFTLGLVLYGVLSPITKAAFDDMGRAMKDPILRFFAVEHLAMGLLAIAAAHIGNTRAKRATTDAARYRTIALFFTISLVILLVSIPWPGREMGRPLFRGF
jgi:hypothetical protein